MSGVKSEEQKRHGIEYAKERQAQYPWMSSFFNARARCNYKKCEMYPFYGGKGIRFLLTKQEVEYLWKRDKAGELKRPSLDRIQSQGDYILSNCRFIELNLNSISNRKISNEDIIKIRQIYALGGITALQISKMYDVRQETISDAISGRTWKHIVSKPSVVPSVEDIEKVIARWTNIPFKNDEMKDISQAIRKMIEERNK